MPLWLGTRWLWVAPAAGGSLRYTAYDDLAGVVRGPAATVAALPLCPAYPVVVLDAPAGLMLAADDWCLLTAGVVPGGTLFLCGPLPPGGRAFLSTCAPALRPAGRHLITPGSGPAWHLRPATATSRHLVDRELDSAESLGAWLGQVRRQLRPARQARPCWPFWHDAEVAR